MASAYSGAVTQSGLRVLSTRDPEMWADAVSESFVPITMSIDGPAQFFGRMRSRAMGDIFVCEVTSTAHQVERTERLIARGGTDYYQLSLQLKGTSLLVQQGREATLHRGDIAIYDSDQPYSVALEPEFQSFVVMFPKGLMDLPREAISQLTATRIPGDQGLARMVAPFLTHLTKNIDRLTGASGLRLIHNTLDLVTTVLHSELDARAADQPRRAALVQEIRAYIDEHLSDVDLNPVQIATKNFISTRHLHGIFKDQGVTVSAWIRSRRLEHSRRDLADPIYAHLSVAAVAARWGLTDPSHFSRLFRSTFGESPSEFRERAQARA